MSINQWIPVTIALPVDTMLDAEVLIAAPGGYVASGYYNSMDDTWHYYDGSGAISGVTHWMPLPEPPK